MSKLATELEKRCLELNLKIRNLENQNATIEYLRHEEEKRNREEKTLLKNIKYIAESNDYDRPDVILNKIKDLVRNYQPENQIL